MDLRTVRTDWGAEPLEIVGTAPLTQADLRLLQTEERGRSTDGAVRPLERLTNRHHALARLLATGSCTQGEAGIIMGYADATISILKQDPSFQQLITFYQNEVAEEFRGFQAQLAGVAEDALAELHSRIEDPETRKELGAAFLLDVVTKIADRTGHGTSSTTKVEGTVVLDLAARMKQARQQAQDAIEGISARDITPKVLP